MPTRETASRHAELLFLAVTVDAYLQQPH